MYMKYKLHINALMKKKIVRVQQHKRYNSRNGESESIALV